MSLNCYPASTCDHVSALPKPTPGEGSVEKQATTYEGLVRTLHEDAVILQWLPSEAEVDQLFDEQDGTPAPRLRTGRPNIIKLAFGTYREEDNTVAQVYVYLRSPSFSNTEPSMMFTKYTAKTKYIAVNTKHINCTSGAFEPNEIWRPFVLRSGKIHFIALRAVVKAIFIRKGISLSVPIPVTSSQFRSALILGCDMFRTYAESAKEEEMKVPSKHATLENCTVLSHPSSSNRVEDELTSQNTTIVNCGTESIENDEMSAGNDETLIEEPSFTPQCIGPRGDRILANIIQPLSASRNHRRTLTENILGKTIEKDHCASSLDTLRLEGELLETEIERQQEEAERSRAAIREKIHAKEQEVSKMVAEIEKDMHIIQKKHEGEKRRLTQLTPDLAAVWHLSREYAYDEFCMSENHLVKRQKKDD